MSEPLVVTAEEAADLLRVSVWTVASMTRDGRLPKVAGLRRIRIPYAAVKALTEGYDATDAKPHRQAQAEASPPRRRDRLQADGPLESEALGGDSALHRPTGPAEGDVVVRVVERRGR